MSHECPAYLLPIFLPSWIDTGLPSPSYRIKLLFLGLGSGHHSVMYGEQEYRCEIVREDLEGCGHLHVQAIVRGDLG